MTSGEDHLSSGFFNEISPPYRDADGVIWPAVARVKLNDCEIDDNALYTADNLKTLFHEFGHALDHFMRQPSGDVASPPIAALPPHDLIETASQLLELCATDSDTVWEVVSQDAQNRGEDAAIDDLPVYEDLMAEAANTSTYDRESHQESTILSLAILKVLRRNKLPSMHAIKSQYERICRALKLPSTRRTEFGKFELARRTTEMLTGQREFFYTYPMGLMLASQIKDQRLDCDQYVGEDEADTQYRQAGKDVIDELFNCTAKTAEKQLSALVNIDWEGAAARFKPLDFQPLDDA